MSGVFSALGEKQQAELCQLLFHSTIDKIKMMKVCVRMHSALVNAGMKPPADAVNLEKLVSVTRVLNHQEDALKHYRRKSQEGALTDDDALFIATAISNVDMAINKLSEVLAAE